MDPAGHQLLLTLVAPSPPFLWAQPKELTKPFERGPQRPLLEVIIFFRLFFSFPLLIAELTSSPLMKGSFVSWVAGQSLGLAAGCETRVRLLHIPLQQQVVKMALSATAMSLPLWLPSEKKKTKQTNSYKNPSF